MARLLYTLLWYLLTPFLLLRLLWRARKQPAYLKNLAERFGFYAQPVSSRLIWLHAVSVGETRAAQPLIDGLLAAFPEHILLLTCMTPTGRETGANVYQAWGGRVIQAYLPYEYPWAITAFFKYFRPQFGVLMETEVWPNLLTQAVRHGVPVYLANARLSERSARGYARLASLLRPAFASLAGVMAQTDGDAQRLLAVGAEVVRVCGNLKFDVNPPPEKLELGKRWRSLLNERPVWLAASTREGEESLILDAWLAHGGANTLLVLVPRHPQRFGAVADLLRARGVNFGRRSQGLPTAAMQVWLGDSMGEMPAYYAMANLAFVGGSLLPLGGQNLIEAAACACPVLIGPHTFNFRQATEDAIAAGAARRVADASSLVSDAANLLADQAALAGMRQAAGAFAAAHRGAAARMLALISEWSGPAGR